MVVISVDMSSLFFFMLGFLVAIGMVVLLAIVWIIFPRLAEAKRFFQFWLRMRDKEKKE
jgi:hypothetical protein